MSRRIKIAIKAIRLARTSIQSYIEYVEAGEGGPIDEGSKSKLARIQGEIDILTAIVEEVRRRQPDEEEGTT